MLVSWIRAEEGCMRVGGGDCLKYLEGGGTEKEEGKQCFKEGGSWVKGWVP